MYVHSGEVLYTIDDQNFDQTEIGPFANNDSITDIAAQTGYTRPNHLFRTFRSHFGTSPRQYREAFRQGGGE